jgi:hypothetical protein
MYFVPVASNKRIRSLEYFVISYNIKSKNTKVVLLMELKCAVLEHNDINVSSGEETIHSPKGREMLPTVLSFRISIIGEFY